MEKTPVYTNNYVKVNKNKDKIYYFTLFDIMACEGHLILAKWNNLNETS